MAALHETVENMRASIMEGEHRGSDVKKKIAFQKQLNEAEIKAYHAFGQPEEPSRVRAAQGVFENASDGFVTEHMQPVDRMARTLRGEEVKGANSDEAARLKKAEVVTKDLPPEELSTLKAEIDAAHARLQELKPEIEEVAKEKMLPPDKKEDKLKQYTAMHENYQKMRKDLTDILEQLRAS